MWLWRISYQSDTNLTVVDGQWQSEVSDELGNTRHVVRIHTATGRYHEHHLRRTDTAPSWICHKYKQRQLHSAVEDLSQVQAASVTQRRRGSVTSTSSVSYTAPSWICHKYKQRQLHSVVEDLSQVQAFRLRYTDILATCEAFTSNFDRIFTAHAQELLILSFRSIFSHRH